MQRTSRGIFGCHNSREVLLAPGWGREAAGRPGFSSSLSTCLMRCPLRLRSLAGLRDSARALKVGPRRAGDTGVAKSPQGVTRTPTDTNLPGDTGRPGMGRDRDRKADTGPPGVGRDRDRKAEAVNVGLRHPGPLVDHTSEATCVRSRRKPWGQRGGGPPGVQSSPEVRAGRDTGSLPAGAGAASTSGWEGEWAPGGGGDCGDTRCGLRSCVLPASPARWPPRDLDPGRGRGGRPERRGGLRRVAVAVCLWGASPRARNPRDGNRHACFADGKLRLRSP